MLYVVRLLIDYFHFIFLNFFYKMMKNRQQRLTMKKVEIQCRNNTDYYVSIVQKFRWNKLHCSILVLFYIRTTINDSVRCVNNDITFLTYVCGFHTKDAAVLLLSSSSLSELH